MLLCAAMSNQPKQNHDRPLTDYEKERLKELMAGYRCATMIDLIIAQENRIKQLQRLI